MTKTQWQRHIRETGRHNQENCAACQARSRTLYGAPFGDGVSEADRRRANREANEQDCLERGWPYGATAVAVEVEMLAYENGAIRTVEIPVAEWTKATTTTEKLELVFRYGQNDFQPQNHPSVSVGDVVRLEGQRFAVAVCGFEPAPTGAHYHDLAARLDEDFYNED